MVPEGFMQVTGVGFRDAPALSLDTRRGSEAPAFL